MKKLRFLGTFFLLFALFLFIWNATRGAGRYTAGLLASAAVVGPALHGWVLETEADAHASPTWVRGDRRVQLAIQFDALSIGLVPLVALLAATPGIALRRRLGLIIAGSALCFLVDTLIVALFPLLVFHKNVFTDVIGTFLGLVAFVGAPAIIWFGLTFRELQRWLPPFRPPSLESR